MLLLHEKERESLAYVSLQIPAFCSACSHKKATLYFKKCSPNKQLHTTVLLFILQKQYRHRQFSFPAAFISTSHLLMI